MHASKTSDLVEFEYIVRCEYYTVSQKRNLYTFAHNFFLDEFNNGKISKIRQNLPKLWAKV